MITALDTNILLDLLIPQAHDQNRSKALLDEAYRRGALVICEGVYAELGAQFGGPEELDQFLQETGIRFERSTLVTLQQAGEAWRRYTRRRGKAPNCAECGWKGTIDCPQCGAAIRSRQHLLIDFLVGSHATQQANSLLTRDRGYYRTYFPTLLLQESVQKTS